MFLTHEKQVFEHVREKKLENFLEIISYDRLTSVFLVNFTPKSWLLIGSWYMWKWWFVVISRMFGPLRTPKWLRNPLEYDFPDQTMWKVRFPTQSRVTKTIFWKSHYKKSEKMTKIMDFYLEEVSNFDPTFSKVLQIKGSRKKILKILRVFRFF